jgi:uncharacterized protein
MANFLAPALRTPGASFVLVNERTKQPLVTDLELAVESATRKKGLLGRDGLAPGAGLVIAPTNAVHTFFMRFSIDIVFLNRAGAIVKIKNDVPNRRIAAALRGFAVLELAAGSAARAGLTVGDRLILQLK